MANPIGQIIAAFSSLIVLLIAYVIFGPLIDGVLSGLVLSAIADSGGTALTINSAAFKLTVDLILMGMKLFSWFIIAAILFRMIIYLGFFTEEQGYN